MSQHALTIAYGLPSGQTPDPLDLLLIEQEAWRSSTGVVTKAELVRWLAARLYDREYEERTDCGLVGGSVVCAIYVYPRVAGLLYQFRASWGTLSERSVAMETITETINFQLDAEVDPRYPAREIKSATWMDQTYDASGAIIPNPALTIQGGKITSTVPVYGAVEVRYTTERHAYMLTCPRREEAIDNNYSAVVYGLYAGGLNWLVLEMPPGIDAFEADEDAECGWGSTVGSITAPDDEDWPVEDGLYERRTVVDYCTQLIASDRVY